MNVVQNISEDVNHDSWTIHTDKSVSNLLIEPQIDQVYVDVKVNKISFVQGSENVNVGKISSTSVIMSQKSTFELEYKEDCLKISPNWGDVTLVPEIENIDIGAKFSKIFIEPKIRRVSVRPIIRNLKISNNIQHITFGNSFKKVKIMTGGKTIQFNPLTDHHKSFKRVLKINPIIQEIELRPVIDIIEIISPKSH